MTARELQMGEHDLNERVAKLEEGQRWTVRELAHMREKLDELVELVRSHNGREGNLSWRAIAQLSAAVSGLVAVVTYLVQRLA